MPSGGMIKQGDYILYIFFLDIHFDFVFLKVSVFDKWVVGWNNQKCGPFQRNTGPNGPQRAFFVLIYSTTLLL